MKIISCQLLALCLFIVAGCRLTPAPNQFKEEITPGLGLRGVAAIGMKVGKVSDAKEWGREKESGLQYLDIPDRGIGLTALDGIVRSVNFTFVPSQPASVLNGNRSLFTGATFHGGIAGFTNSVDNLTADSVVSVFGAPPKVVWPSRWARVLLFNGVPMMMHLAHGRGLYLLHYPEAGITFYLDLNRPGKIGSVTAAKAARPSDCIAWHGAVRLGIVKEPRPVADFGEVRGGGGRLHLFTLQNDTSERIRIKEIHICAPGIECDCGCACLEPGESTYLMLLVPSSCPEQIEIHSVVSVGEKTDKTFALKMRKVGCGWDVADAASQPKAETDSSGGPYPGTGGGMRR